MPMKSNLTDCPTFVQHKPVDRDFFQRSARLRDFDIVGKSASLQQALQQAEAGPLLAVAKIWRSG